MQAFFKGQIDGFAILNHSDLEEIAVHIDIVGGSYRYFVPRGDSLEETVFGEKLTVFRCQHQGEPIFFHGNLRVGICTEKFADGLSILKGDGQRFGGAFHNDCLISAVILGVGEVIPHDLVVAVTGREKNQQKHRKHY